MTPRARGRRALSVVLVLIFALFASACRGAASDAPRAREGVLDLRGWSFDQGNVELRGEWRLIPGALVEPSVLAQTAGVTDGVPGEWNEVETGQGPMGSSGVATYALTVLLPSGTPELSVRARPVTSAHRLWINGTERPGAGVVSADLDAVVASTPNRLHTLPTGAQRVEIVVWVANVEHREGGLRKAWLLGPSPAIQAEHGGWIVFDSVVLALMFAVGAYYGLLYFVRRKGDFYLWFALLVVGVGLRTTTTAGNAQLALLLAPNFSFGALTSLEYVTSWMCVIFGLEMIHRLYREQSVPLVKWALQGVAALMALVTLVTPPSLFMRAVSLFQLTALLGVGLTLVILVRAIRAKREGSRSLLTTISFVTLAIVHDVFRSQGILGTPFELGGPSFVGLIVVEAGLLARSFARSFNLIENLSSELSASNRDLVATNEAVERFVPFEFLEMLERSSIRDVARGDYTNLTMDVLFSDIRSFTTIAEDIDPQRTFDFINDYLRHMEPPVHANEGFIDSYQGDGILALFYGGADKALAAAIGMLRGLEKFNATQDYVPEHTIRIGIGLNSGELMLGTIGGLRRLDNSVVGDPVNVASRVEGMTKMYGTPLLISDSAMARLDHPDAFQIRPLDRVVAKGKTEAMDIYEILDGLPKARRACCWAMRETFAKGVAAYRRGQFAAALEAFEACVSACPDDRPAQIYLARCQAYMAEPPRDWQGLTVLETK